jgi:catechol 2,3-dioxygenase-like lactoylglutathione lyase family enzyme
MLKDRKLHATIPVADMARARAFYEGTLGFAPSAIEPGGTMYDAGGGTRFVLYPSGPLAGTAAHTLAGFSVADIDAEVAELKGRGVVFAEYDTEYVKTVDSIATTGNVRAAWFKDSEGNILGIGQLPFE